MNKIPDEVIKEIFPRKLQRNLVSAQVYNHLKQMVLTGKLKKGQRLIQETLALRFDVSRMTLRSVLFKLKKEGLITGRKGSGTIVK
jgi:DNA-binding GntR family transcriptional regulator